MTALPPVITIDGPSGAGKGTVAMRLAENLGFHLLDSGAVYRAAAIKAIDAEVDLSDENAVLSVLENWHVVFEPNGADGVLVTIDDVDVTNRLRTQLTAEAASQIAVMPQVRLSLMDEQRSFRAAPGLVADGRDMGTVVFPDASLKVFLTASAERRAERRAKQLKEKGISTTIPALLAEIEQRDTRDSTREHAPMVAAPNALQIDSSHLSIDSVVQHIIDHLQECAG